MELRADGETYSWNGSMITRLENLAVNGSVNGDVLTGGRLDDWLDGGAGDDIFEGGHGNDQLLDTAGDDNFFWYERQQSQSTLGADYISSSADSDYQDTGGSCFSFGSIDTLIGGAGNETLVVLGDKGDLNSGAGTDVRIKTVAQLEMDASGTAM